MSLRILGCILAVILGAQAFPQRPRQHESSDFNYNGKPGEKTFRSLDQISLQDGNVRGGSSYTDSYGNPVAYDSLDDVNAQRPSNNKNNPHQYIIPGYASGILDSGEIPSRSSVNDEDRRVNDEKIHFIDPLNQNSFQSFNNAPSPSLTVPGFNSQSQSPIEIPRPNIDLQETPISTVDASLNSNFPNAPLSTILEVPIDQGSSNRPFATGLVPPQISSSDGVEIPRPNLDIHETPIDDSNNLLNQGLLPPTSAQPNFNTLGTNIFSNSKQDGPVVITDEQTVFAPKPSNGLLPPKDPIPNNFNFQSIPSINNALPSSTTSSKFNQNFGGTIGGGITTASPLQIPVHVIHSQDDGKVNKYTGTFGGSPGVLVSNNQLDRVIPTHTTRVQPTTSTIVNNVQPTRGTTLHDKFTGSFGGSIGVLSPNASPVGVPSTVQTVTNIPSTQSNNSSFPSKKKVSLTFGGPEGVLRPYDNLQKN